MKAELITESQGIFKVVVFFLQTFLYYRAEFCKCDSEQDFGAKLYCLRKGFRQFMNDEHKMNWLIQSGRVLIADLLRHSGREVTSFYNAYDRMMEFLLKEENCSIIIEELEPRKV